MINNVLYKKILDDGLTLDHYHVLCSIRNGKELPNTKRIQGFLNLLNKKGYIEDGVLSEDAVLLIEENLTTTTTFTTTVNERASTFTTWSASLHKKCQDKIKELTGKTQVTDRINKKAYSFLPNVVDFQKVIQKVIILYKIKDMEKVEKCILNYIVKCNDAKNWFPILRYYILKDNHSRLVTDLESEEDNSQQRTTNQKFV